MKIIIFYSLMSQEQSFIKLKVPLNQELDVLVNPIYRCQYIIRKIMVNKSFVFILKHKD